MPDEYTFTVKFKRSVYEDRFLIEDQNLPPSSPIVAQQLMQQLRKELQACYDNPNVSPAGGFVIESMQHDNCIIHFGKDGSCVEQ
jgi:hypothetical protein